MNFKEYQNELSKYVFQLSKRYDISQRDMASLINIFKEFAAIYHEKMEAGEIEEPYTRNDRAALDFMNGQIEEEV